MSAWREDNFLERLVLSSPKHAGLRLCPEAETLRAGSDSEGTKAILSTPSQHTQHCPACSDLQHRLIMFDQAESAWDSEGMEAERRLDSWLKGFLASHSLHSRTPVVVVPPKIVPRLSTAEHRPFRQMHWALAAAATFVIVVGLVYIRRAITVLTPSPEVAQSTSVEQAPVPDSQALPEPVPAEPSHPAAPVPEAARARAPKPSTASSGTAAPPPPQQSVTLPTPSPQVVAQQTQPSDESAPNQTAIANPPNPVGSQRIQAAPVVLGPQTGTRQAPSPPAKAANQNANAKTMTARTVSAPVSPSPSSQTPRSSVSVVHANPVPPGLVGHATVHLPAGTRVWLSLTSVDSLPDGRFQFRAGLLLPISVSGAVLFDKGAQLAGSGQTIAGRTSIQITEVVTSGKRYRPGPASNQSSTASASGKAVRFQSGQVLEMWLDSPATFAVEGGSSTGPPK
jgi:hypothetical protein